MDSIEILSKKAKQEKIEGWSTMSITELIERLASVKLQSRFIPCTYIGLGKSEPCGQPSISGTCGVHRKRTVVKPCQRCGFGCRSQNNICMNCGYLQERKRIIKDKFLSERQQQDILN